MKAMSSSMKHKTIVILIVIALAILTICTLRASACGGKPHCTPKPPVVVTPPTPPVTPPTTSSTPSPSGTTSSGSMMNPCNYFPNPAPNGCQTTPSQQYQWNNSLIREQIMDAWRCRTFGANYCSKTASQPITSPTPAEIYGK